MTRRSFKWFCGYWGWKCRKLIRNGDLPIHSRMFDGYMSNAFEMPEFSAKGDAKLVDRAAPWHWRLLVILETQFHMSPGEAADTPVAVANMLWLTKAEMDDAVTIASDVDPDFWEWAARQDAERAKN